MAEQSPSVFCCTSGMNITTTFLVLFDFFFFFFPWKVWCLEESSDHELHWSIPKFFFPCGWKCFPKWFSGGWKVQFLILAFKGLWHHSVFTCLSYLYLKGKENVKLLRDQLVHCGLQLGSLWYHVLTELVFWFGEHFSFVKTWLTSGCGFCECPCHRVEQQKWPLDRHLTSCITQ